MTQPIRPVGRRVDLEGSGLRPRPRPVAQGTSPALAAHANPVLDHLANDGEDHQLGSLVFPGELLTIGTTLAVILGNDQKESYFSAKHTAIVQPGESHDDVIGRSIEVANTSVFANISDVLEQTEGDQRAGTLRVMLEQAGVYIPADATDDTLEQIAWLAEAGVALPEGADAATTTLIYNAAVSAQNNQQ